MYLFFQVDLLQPLWEINAVTREIGIIVRPLIPIWMVFSFSYLCRDVKLFNVIGKDTLYLCGSEYLIKTTIPFVLSMIGLSINISNPYVAYIYTFLLLLTSHYLFVPIERKIVKKIQSLFSTVSK